MEVFLTRNRIISERNEVPNLLREKKQIYGQKTTFEEKTKHEIAAATADMAKKEKDLVNLNK